MVDLRAPGVVYDGPSAWTAAWWSEADWMFG